MKILCVADHKDPLIYSSGIKYRFGDVDIVLSAGDLAMDYYSFISSMLNKPILFVFGNHCLERISRFRPELAGYGENGCPDPDVPYETYGATYIGGRVQKIKGLIITGLGGSRNYNNGINQYSELGMYVKILKLIPKLIWNRITQGRFTDILLTHTPPYGFNDENDPCHRGFKAFLWFCRVFKPQYLIHGHIHLYDINAERENVYEKTRIINAYNHILLEVDTDRGLLKGKRA